MLGPKIYEFVGKLTILSASAILFLSLVSLLLGYLMMRRDRLFFARFVLFFIDSFQGLLRLLADKLGLGEDIVDIIGIEIRNRLYERDFASTPVDRRILVLPQCLRSEKCPAKIRSDVGILCVKCGACVIARIKEFAENLGYKVFVVPGSTFVKRIVSMYKPLAALGVACHRDLNAVMSSLSRKGIITQGVRLSKDGCINTRVEVERVFKKLLLGLGERV